MSKNDDVGLRSLIILWFVQAAVLISEILYTVRVTNRKNVREMI